MLEALSSADGISWLSICVKALVYAATLLAAGSVMAILFLQSLPEAERRRAEKLAPAMAIIAAALSLLLLPIRASFLVGGTWAGATDPAMLNIVMESPLGFAIALRVIGLILICAILLPGRIARGSAFLGAILVAASFAMRGHALEEPRLALGLLVTLHILGLAFWAGVFFPLHCLSRHAEPKSAGALAEEFGHKALWIVGALALAGLATLLLLTGGQLVQLKSPYIQFFALKLLLFTGAMGFAAWNKLRLTPALLRGQPDAGATMDRSLRGEAFVLALVLLTTSALTTVSSP